MVLQFMSKNLETYVGRNIREIKIHVYRKRQTSDLSSEFLRIENKQIKNSPERFLWIKKIIS